MYRVKRVIVKYDRDMLCRIIKDKSEDIIESILMDCELRPETKRIYIEVTDFDNLSIALNFYNKELEEFDFEKDPFKSVASNIYINYIQLLEIGYDEEALCLFDIVAKCNELTGGDSV